MLKKADRYLIQLALFISLIGGIVLFSSCSKNQDVKENCKCGTVFYKETGSFNGHTIYGIRATNECSSNDTIAEVSKDVYNATTVGSTQCFNATW